MKHEHLHLKLKQCARHPSLYGDVVSVVLVLKHGASEAVQQNWFGIQKFDGVQNGKDVHMSPSLQLLLLLFLSLPNFTLKSCLS